MPYGSYDGPDKPDKGKEGGSCNRSRCQASPANWYNHGSFAWYCDDCARDIGQDVMNVAHWERDWRPRCGHGQFETRAQMDERNSASVEPMGSGLLESLNEAMKAMPKRSELWAWSYAPREGGWGFEDSVSKVAICHPDTLKALDKTASHVAFPILSGIPVIYIDGDDPEARKCRDRFMAALDSPRTITTASDQENGQ